jgi:hypothetical protein
MRVAANIALTDIIAEDDQDIWLLVVGPGVLSTENGARQREADKDGWAKRSGPSANPGKDGKHGQLLSRYQTSVEQTESGRLR